MQKHIDLGQSDAPEYAVLFEEAVLGAKVGVRALGSEYIVNNRLTLNSYHFDVEQLSPGAQNH
jgi:hypothetical protein